MFLFPLVVVQGCQVDQGGQAGLANPPRARLVSTCLVQSGGMGPVFATLPSPGGTTPGRRRLTTAAILVAVVVVLQRLVARSLHRVEVVGGSMAPTFLAGDRLVVLSRPAGPQPWPTVGAVVAVADPRDAGRVLVKRVSSVDREAGTLEVRGDAAHVSTDSRTFGPVASTSVIGRVVYRYAPAGRTGPGPWPTEYHRS
jgi:signal peptidase I